MAKYWTKRQIGIFMKRTFLQVGIVTMITVVCVFGASLLGIPVLSVLYNTNLQAYKNELLILLIGGGFWPCRVY